MLQGRPLGCNGPPEQWPLFVRAEKLYWIVQRDHTLYNCHSRNWKEKDQAEASFFSAPLMGPAPETTLLRDERSGPQGELGAPAKGSPG